jgi:hypothetical protein
MRTLIHSFLMICFVLASVSPACAFVSGKHTMEICGADGSVRTMPVPEELLAFMADPVESGQSSDADDHSVRVLDDCAFCFAQTHMKPFWVQSDVLYAPDAELSQLPQQFDAIQRQHVAFYLSRAPPALFS